MVMHLIPEGEQKHTLDDGCGCRPEWVDLLTGQEVRPALRHHPSGELGQAVGARAVTREILHRVGYGEQQIDDILAGPRPPAPESTQEGADGQYLTWTNLLRDGCTEDEAAALLSGPRPGKAARAVTG